MASLHHSVQLSASEPHPQPQSAPDPRRNLSASDTPSSPREGKRKRLTHEASSPNITSKLRKQSQPNKADKGNNRHSIIIEPPMRCTAWDASSDHAATKSETSSLQSEVSTEGSFIELDEKSSTRIRYIINELITTEKVYMQDLHDIATGYMQPMEQCGDLFPPDIVKDIFINIKPIGDFHLDFLMKLDEYEQELDSLVNCFLTKESEDGFSLYNEFCRKVPRSLDLIAEELVKAPSKQFIVDCQQHLNHFFPLSEFLHRPIQRILKYPLLLRDIQKYTTGTKYASIVEAALDQITGVAIHINNVKRVQELESNEIVGWTGDPLLEFGVLKLEDSFKVNGSENRYLFLFEKLLLFTKPHKDGKYQYKAHLLPTEIILTDNNSESLKFDIENFHQKKNKFVVQVTDLEVKKNWVYEIRRCVLEHQPNITPQMREVLLKGIPNMDRANQLDDILSSSKYKSFILLQGLDRDTDQNGPVTPDLDPIQYPPLPLSPTHNTPSPIGQFNYNTPSPDRIPHDDSGIEDPAPKNQVDYSSLDVKAIKDRWIRQDKLSGSNTAPLRAFHRRTSMDRPLVDKSETWPLPDGDNPVEQLKKNNKVASLMDNFKIAQEEQPAPSALKSPSPTKDSAMMKPCLARISHLQDAPEKSSPVYRGIQSLIETDAANSQTNYNDTLFSPDSNIHPDCEGSALFSGLDSSSVKHKVASPKQSNGADDQIFKSQPNTSNTNTIKTNLNNYTKQEKSLKNDDSLELSDSDAELIVRFTKGCNVSGTNTTKRNSFIIDKELHKNIPVFSPQSSEAESESETSETSETSAAARIEKFKARYAKQRHKIEKEEEEVVDQLPSPTDDDLQNYYSNYRTPSPKDVEEISAKISTMTTSPHHDDVTMTTSPRNTLTYAGKAIKTETPRSKLTRTPDHDDRTLTRDEDTLTRDKDTLTRANSHLVYQGSSLIRGSAETKPVKETEEEEEIVMKPIRSSESEQMKPVRSSDKKPAKSKSKLRRAATKDGHHDDSSEEESGSSSNNSKLKRTAGVKKKSGLQKPSASAIPRSDSNSSIPSASASRSKAPTNKTPESRSRTSSANKSATFVKPAPKSSALRTRTPSFNQEDNPFSGECRRGNSTAARQPRAAAAGTVGRQQRATGTDDREGSATIGRQSKASASKSLPTEQLHAEPVKPRGTRLCSDGLTSNRRLAYLNAASKSTTAIKNESEADELNSVRASNLVAKMKSQLLTNTSTSTKIKGPTRSATLKRRYERSNTTQIQPRSRSSPAGSRRSSSVEYKPPERRQSTIQRKPSSIAKPLPERKASAVQRKPSTAQRKPSTRTPAEKPALTRTNTMIRTSTTQRPAPPKRQSTASRQSVTGVGRPSRTSVSGVSRPSTASRPTRIPSPTKSPPCPGIKPSSSSSRLARTAGRLKSSSSTSTLPPESDSSRTSSPVKRSGLSIKTPARMPGPRSRQSCQPARAESPKLSTRSISLADHLDKRASTHSNPNLSQLQSLSKSMSSVNEKSARQARREAARNRAARTGSGDPPPKSAGSETKPRKKFLYGASRTYSVV